MHIALFGAAGILGSRIAEVLTKEQHFVHLQVRDAIKLTVDIAPEYIFEGDGRDAKLVRSALQGCNVVISALGMKDITTKHTNLSDCTRIIVQEMQKLGIKRIIALASYGVLPHPEGGLYLDHDWPTWLENLGEEHERVWKILSSTNLDWTLVCPTFFNDDLPGATYRTAVESMPQGSDMVTVDNLTDFIIKEIQENNNIRKRVGIVSDPLPILREVYDED